MADSKDLMATYVKQLMALDESSRNSMLQNLSHYAESKQASPKSTPRKVSIAPPETTDIIWPEHPLGMTMGISGSKAAPEPKAHKKVTPSPAAATVAAATPAKVPLPQGMAQTSPQMQQANGFLHAAVAHWEACMAQEQGIPQRAEQAVHEAFLTQQAQPVSKARRPQAAQHAKAEQAVNPEVMGLLEKALSDLTTSLPPEAAVEAQQLLSKAGVPEAQRGKNVELMKWLTQHLEKQQEASVEKLSKMVMGAPGAPAGHWAPPAGQRAPGGPGWGAGDAAGMGLMQANSARLVPAQRLTAEAAAAGPAFLPLPGNGWWGPGAAGYGMPQSPPQPVMHAPPGLLRKSGGAACAAPESAGRESLETLRMHLRALLKVDPKRVLIVRKINRLGFGSDSVLHAHYSAYGEVERVLVAHSRVKPAVRPGSGQTMGSQHSRLRPSGLGFIVMCLAESAQYILAQGSEQLVDGSVIKVQQFERRMSEEAAGEADDAEEGEEEEPSSK